MSIVNQVNDVAHEPLAFIEEIEENSAISDILLWAIFANRKELAEICWLRSENHLCEFTAMYMYIHVYVIIIDFEL